MLQYIFAKRPQTRIEEQDPLQHLVDLLPLHFPQSEAMLPLELSHTLTKRLVHEDSTETSWFPLSLAWRRIFTQPSRDKLHKDA